MGLPASVTTRAVWVAILGRKERIFEVGMQRFGEENANWSLKAGWEIEILVECGIDDLERLIDVRE
jgi:hypothetical protein